MIGRLALGAVGAKVDLMGLYQRVAALGASYVIWIFAGANYTTLVILLYAWALLMAVGCSLPAVTAYLFGPVGLEECWGAIHLCGDRWISWATCDRCCYRRHQL